MKRPLSKLAMAGCISLLALPALAATQSTNTKIPPPSSTLASSPRTPTDAESANFKMTPQERIFYQKAVAQAEADLRKSMQKQLSAEQKKEAQDYYVNLGGALVKTSPYVGQEASFDGGDLITNLPSVGKNLSILKQRAIVANRLKAKGVTLPNHPRLDLSGDIEMQAAAGHLFNSNNWGDINLTNAELDMVIEGPQWVTGFMDFEYDDSVGDNDTPNNRTANSDLYVGQAFMIIGDLNKTPFYVTTGQMYAPFGDYGSYAVTDTTPDILGETKVRSVEGGYFKHGLNLNAYGYKSAATNNGGAPNDNEEGWGLNADFKHALNAKGTLNNEVGVSYIASLADSNGMQLGPIGFNGIGYESLQNKVPGLDFRDVLVKGPYVLQGQVVTATEHFSSQDVAINGRGSRPVAGHIEGDYNFNIAAKPAAVMIGYDQTSEALALALPKRRETLEIIYSFFRDTTTALEYRHEKDYGSDEVATMGNGTSSGTITGTGNTQNIATLEFDMYF